MPRGRLTLKRPRSFWETPMSTLEITLAYGKSVFIQHGNDNLNNIEKHLLQQCCNNGLYTMNIFSNTEVCASTRVAEIHLAIGHE